MPQFQSASRVVRSLITRTKHVRQISKPVNPLSHLHKPSPPRFLSHIAGVRYPKSVNGHFRKDSSYLAGGICNQFQKRPFWGVEMARKAVCCRKYTRKESFWGSHQNSCLTLLQLLTCIMGLSPGVRGEILLSTIQMALSMQSLKLGSSF